ncbi:MAG: ABC transporter ATP-binding protein [Actinomycetota bacterium]|nr:ABC transporter ATP-binding protein [Actinomycetota bacterium]
MDLMIPRGSIYGFIGPNGAGKSTTFSILATLLLPTGGEARVCGFDPVHDPVEVRRRIGYMPDAMGVYDRLNVAEYLEFYAGAYKVPRDEWDGLIGNLLELVDLDVKRESMVDSLSRGMKQRLSLARALVHDPELLILDEPASGLDPRARVEFRDLVLTLRELGKTVLISSHILAELSSLCTEVAIIEAGRLLAAGSPAAILDQLGHGRQVRVRLADGTEQLHAVADEAAQHELLRRLVVDESLPVVEFAVVSTGLEELFMSITKGVVQ